MHTKFNTKQLNLRSHDKGETPERDDSRSMLDLSRLLSMQGWQFSVDLPHDQNPKIKGVYGLCVLIFSLCDYHRSNSRCDFEIRIADGLAHDSFIGKSLKKRLERCGVD